MWSTAKPQIAPRLEGMEVALTTVVLAALLRNVLPVDVLLPVVKAAAGPERAAPATPSDHATAVAHLRTALAGELELDERFRATMLLAGLLGQGLRPLEAAAMLEEQLEAFASRPDLQRAAEAALVSVTRADPESRARAAQAIERLRDGGESDPAVLGTLAAEMALAGEPADRTAQVAERAVHAATHGWSLHDAVRALVIAERYDLAKQALAKRPAIDALGLRAELRLRIGDLAGAEADARRLLELATHCGWPLAAASAVAVLVEVLIERGALEDAAELFSAYPTERLLLARGRLRLAQGRIDEAVEDLRECGRRELATGSENPAATPWRSLLAQALLARGESEEARRLAAEELDRARAFGAARATGIALRAAALAAHDHDELALLREAVAILEPSEARLELARAYADLGAALRRAGHEVEARDPLRAALDLAHRCGASALEDRALAELRASGARPRRRAATGAGALTRSERRIAELAAAGHKNREIAEKLFVTMATVEFHLRHAYRKLGIASRTELRPALAA